MPGMEEWPTGKVEQVHPLVRRLLAPNPSPFTYTGTEKAGAPSGFAMQEITLPAPARALAILPASR